MDRPMAFLAFTQNYTELHVHGKGPTFRGEVRPGILNLFINEAALEVRNAQIVASTDSETWINLDRDHVASIQWVMTPRHPYIGGDEQEIIDFRDITPLRHKANVACYKVIGRYARTVTSALRHILSQNSQIRKVVLFGIGTASGHHRKFSAETGQPPFTRDAVRRVREEVEDELRGYEVDYQFL